MQTRIIQSLHDIAAADWNRLNPEQNPFLQHEFLVALENHRCVGENFGWLPRHIALYDEGQLVAAMPLYLKDNSYGEFVFDWSWADAYHRNGIPYYPKLVCSVPYTPVTGQRLLVAPEREEVTLRKQLVQESIELAKQLGVSSLHWLFPEPEEAAAFEQPGLLKRIGTQFHWFNQNFANFDAFLQTMSAAKRKKIKRERRRVVEDGIAIRSIRGDQATEEERARAEHFYRTTFDKKFGYATLNKGFFDEICQTMGDRVMFFFAYYQQTPVACAICLQNDTALYGRHWGCDQTFHSLHFELCYYQGIEHCIKSGRTVFEPGAQGEHKISRGFIPVETYSMHWIEHDQFREGIARYLDQETEAIKDYMQELCDHLPYKSDCAPQSVARE